MGKVKKAVSLPRAHKPPHLTLREWQVSLRREFGKIQNFRFKNIGEHAVFSEYAVSNPSSGGSYRVAIRGEKSGDNFCSCPDFSINTLGTCKHIEFVLHRLRRKTESRKMLSGGFSLPFSEVFLRYGLRRQVVFLSGSDAPPAVKKLAGEYFDANSILRDQAFLSFDTFLRKVGSSGHQVRCYDDVLSFIAEVQDAYYRRRRLEQKFSAGIESKAFEHLLKVPLYPYQRQGTLFAVEAGRLLIADDMGLGKTVQALAAAEILAREFGIQKALIVCPTSLKYQWKNEIEKFCGRSVCVIEGGLSSRVQLYARDDFFKVVNYELVFRDLKLIEKLAADLVILDEAQRIKNWKTRAAQSIKRIKSTYAIALTGTPLENRLEELHSIVEFVDRYRLGPLFHFLDNHQEVDAHSGKVTGYRNLKAIGKTLSSIMIRRTKAQVISQLPERMDKNFFVPMTEEQMIHHEENRDIASRIAAKWARYKFLSESDQRRLMIALQYMRMSCDSTYLIDQKTRFGRKLDELTTVLEEIFETQGAKVVVFSQWERMTSLVAELLSRKGWQHVYLHGGVPAIKRKDLINTFHGNSACRVFLSTDAGGLGLNLQAASTVINLDLPWNPATLEQRISRVHRLGQRYPVRVINFISQGTIEHNMLSVLRFKKALFSGVLENGQDSVYIGKSRISKFMESVEEITRPVSSMGAHSSGNEPRMSPVEKEAGRESAAESYRRLFSAGAQLLQALADNFSADGKSGSVLPAATVETAAEDQKSYLKIPLIDKQSVRKVLPVIDYFVAALKNIST